MAPRLALLAALASAVAIAAETLTVSLFSPLGLPQQELRGSVVSVDGDKTTYAIGCAPDTPPDSCPTGSPLTLMQGVSTMSQSIVYTLIKADDAAVFTEDLLCELDAEKGKAECSGGYTATYGGAVHLKQYGQSIRTYRKDMVPVIITAGVDKLSAAPSATSTASGITSTASKADADQSLPTPTPGLTASQATNHAGRIVTQNALLAGVALFIRGALVV